MAYTVPTASDFKAHFTRDFPYGSTDTTVMDSDITKAIAEAAVNFNESLWESQAVFTLAYLYLTAHYLVTDLRASSQGIAGSYSWLTGSKSVGSVSEGFSIPQKILDNPHLAMLSKTNYGAKFLSLALPRLVGNVVHVAGETQA